MRLVILYSYLSKGLGKIIEEGPLLRESKIHDYYSIVLSGAAGSGIQAIGEILTWAFRLDGFHVFSSGEFMSRIRGGSNSTLIRIGSRPVRSWSDAVDLCIPLDNQALNHVKSRLTTDTLILSDHATIGTGAYGLDIPLTAMAAETGKAIYANTVAAGAIWGLYAGNFEHLGKAIEHHFAGKPTETLEQNRLAARKGYEFSTNIRLTSSASFRFPSPPSAPHPLFLTGAEAVACGALAGGCSFVSSYPMSPSTGVLTFLAQQAHEFGIAVEQAEDEISAANMVLGAWYAGARGLTTTSGGGFSLMTETISLAGMIESPMVIHLAQRPGPATGLPTRTAQEDLQLALYAGHGEFPRILLAPGNLEQAYDLTRRAFDLADACQVPVIILTDQYLMDSGYDVEPPDIPQIPGKPAIVKTDHDYHRYGPGPQGVSPRGIPGWGTGLVGVDSDEHDQEAHITEKAEVRVAMVEKRLHKATALLDLAIPPEWIGPIDAEAVVVCWGSTLEPLREAVSGLAKPNLAILHFSQVYPLHSSGQALIEGKRRLILAEGNGTGQFGRLLTGEWGTHWQHRLLKFDGAPFSAEGLRQALVAILQQEVR